MLGCINVSVLQFVCVHVLFVRVSDSARINREAAVWSTTSCYSTIRRSQEYASQHCKFIPVLLIASSQQERCSIHDAVQLHVTGVKRHCLQSPAHVEPRSADLPSPGGATVCLNFNPDLRRSVSIPAAPPPNLSTTTTNPLLFPSLPSISPHISHLIGIPTIAPPRQLTIPLEIAAISPPASLTTGVVVDCVLPIPPILPPSPRPPMRV